MNIKVLLTLLILIPLTFSCKNTKEPEAEPIIPTDTKATMEYNENRLDSIPANREFSGAFKGSGSEPFWSVTLDADKILFESADADLKSFTAPLTNPEISGNSTTFTADQKDGIIKVTLLEEKCTGAMNGIEMTHKVKVSLKLKNDKDFRNFEGCGAYEEWK